MKRRKSAGIPMGDIKRQEQIARHTEPLAALIAPPIWGRTGFDGGVEAG